MRIWSCLHPASVKSAFHQTPGEIAIQMACFVDHNWWRPRDGRSNWAGPRAADFPLPYGCPADFIWEPHYLTGPARCYVGCSCTSGLTCAC